MELRRSWQGIERELRRNGEGIEKEMIWNGKGTDLELNRLGRVQGDSRWNCNGIAMELHQIFLCRPCCEAIGFEKATKVSG